MVTKEEVLVAFNAAVGYLGEHDQLEAFVDWMADNKNTAAYSTLHVSVWIESLDDDSWAELVALGLENSLEFWEARQADENHQTALDSIERELESEDDNDD